MKRHLYVVVTKNLGDFINKEISEPCNCKREFEKMISPLFESSESGLTQMASLLGYFYHNGINAEHLLLCFSKVRRFPPLSVNLYRLLEHEKHLNVRDIVAITGPLFTIFKKLINEVENDKIFEYNIVLELIERS